MNSIVPTLLFLVSLTLSSTVESQGRAPHGLSYENTMAFSPSAYDFFHPNAQKPDSKDLCHATKCSPLPLAAQFAETQAYETSASSQKLDGRRNQLSAGGIAGIIFGIAFAVLLAMGAYYVITTRRANMTGAIPIKPDV